MLSEHYLQQNNLKKEIIVMVKAKSSTKLLLWGNFRIIICFFHSSVFLRGRGELFSNPNTGGIGGLHLDLSLLIRRQFVHAKYKVT